MPTIALPMRPQVEHFFPQTTVARVCGDRYVDDGVHLDTQARLYRHSPPETFITTWTAGYPATNFSIHSLALARNVVYRVRIRYQNVTGWSPWSKPAYEKVGPSLPFASLSVPAEPQNGGSLPYEPSYVIPLDSNRPIIDRRTGTQHIVRRPLYTGERTGTQFLWELNTSEKDLLMTFLNARIKNDPPQAFATNNAEYGARYWVTMEGLIEVSMLDPSNWIVRCTAYEVPGDQLWTIDASAVGGENPLA